jgi:hypothetical protein
MKSFDGTGNPWLDLAAAIMAQAVEDVRVLRSYGVIRDQGKVMAESEWPCKDYQRETQVQKLRRKYCGTYMHPAQVKDLVMWFQSPCGHIRMTDVLEVVAPQMGQDEVCKMLGLEYVG